MYLVEAQGKLADKASERERAKGSERETDIRGGAGGENEHESTRAAVVVMAAVTAAGAMSTAARSS